jgi:hypothetical protein
VKKVRVKVPVKMNAGEMKKKETKSEKIKKKGNKR